MKARGKSTVFTLGPGALHLSCRSENSERPDSVLDGVTLIPALRAFHFVADMQKISFDRFYRSNTLSCHVMYFNSLRH